MDTAYGYGKNHPQNSRLNEVQETLHFRYLKFLVNISMNNRGWELINPRLGLVGDFSKDSPEHVGDQTQGHLP